MDEEVENDKNKLVDVSFHREILSVSPLSLTRLAEKLKRG
jgi:hypothetical protein